MPNMQKVKVLLVVGISYQLLGKVYGEYMTLCMQKSSDITESTFSSQR